jgi:hypothetical protein
MRDSEEVPDVHQEPAQFDLRQPREMRLGGEKSPRIE